MSDDMTTTGAPVLVVRTASPPKARYTGDGEWFAECDEPNCGVWRIGFTEANADTMMADHLRRVHGR